MMPNFIRRRLSPSLCVAAVAVALIVTWSSSAAASPWTLPQDHLVLNMDYHIEQADAEYLSDGSYQYYPLDGQLRTKTMRLGVRYGFTDHFEGAIDFDVSQVNYSADPLLLDDDFDSPGEATASILDFNSTMFGAGDLRFRGNYNFFRSSRGLALLILQHAREVAHRLSTSAGDVFRRR